MSSPRARPRRGAPRHGVTGARSAGARWSARGLGVVLAVALGGGTAAAADGTEIDFDASGRYRGYTFDAEWSQYQEHLLEESLRIAYRSFIVERALASYNVGLSLGMADQFVGGSHDRYFQLDGEVGTEIWRGGLVPITLWARRNTMDVSRDAVPSQHVYQDSAGYTAAFVPKVGPRIRTHGYTSNTYLDGPEGSTFGRQSEIGGDLTHHSQRLSTRAEASRQVVTGDLTGQERIVDTARVDADYQIVDSVNVVARGLSRGFRFSTASGETESAADDADVLVRWTPSERLLGAVRSRVSRYDFAGRSTASTDVSASFGAPHPDPFGLVGTVGAERSSYEDEEGEHAFVGEYVQTEGTYRAAGPNGLLLAETQGGVAHFAEEGVGAGIQEGAALRLWGSREVAGRMLRVAGGGNLGRQWDSSPRALDYLRYGWEAELDSRPARGVAIHVRANRLVHAQLSQDVGDLDLFQVYGTARLQVARTVRVDYGLTQSWQTMDGAYGASIGHSLRANVRLSETLTWSASGLRFLYEDDASDPWWWTRAETELRLEDRTTTLAGRVAVDLATGDTARTSGLFFWVEFTRRFRWTL